jgi:hypothetical protein
MGPSATGRRTLVGNGARPQSHADMEDRGKPMSEGTRRVLVVTSSPATREAVGGWLEEAGREVLLCPGPSAPEFVCVGSLDRRCPLASVADVVVLDLWLASDTAMRGAPGWELLLLYTEFDHPVVAIAGPDDPVRPIPDQRVRVISRPPHQTAVLDAVASLLGERVGA